MHTAKQATRAEGFPLGARCFFCVCGGEQAASLADRQ